MKIKCPLLLIMLVVSSLVAAQNAAPLFQIKGVLLDSLTQEGEPYATIKIVKKRSTGPCVEDAGDRHER